MPRALVSALDRSAGKESGDGNILVELFPVQAETREFDQLAFLLSCIEQARKPGN
jgi:hypothetical protein